MKLHDLFLVEQDLAFYLEYNQGDLSLGTSSRSQRVAPVPINVKLIYYNDYKP